MTDAIEQKALALVNEVNSYTHWLDIRDVGQGPMIKALCRAIEQHEAFRQEVSDAVVEYFDPEPWNSERAKRVFARFIISKPVDPLVEVMAEVSHVNDAKAAEELRQALAKRGYEIREKAGE